MKVETKKPLPSEFRQDLLRGIRWGAILLIAMLLSIAAYRVISSTPATASVATPAPVELTPTLEIAPAEASTIQVGDAVLKGPEPPSAPEPVKVRKPAAKKAPAPVVPPDTPRLQAPNFAPLPVVAPKAKSNALISEPLPEVADVPTPAVELPSPRTTTIAPPPEDNPKQGNRATRAVRSVGRIFGFGRKDPDAKQAESK